MSLGRQLDWPTTVTGRRSCLAESEVLEGTVDRIDYDRRIFDVRTPIGTISVALPSNAKTSDVDAFRRLRTATASEWKESSSTEIISKFHRLVLANAA
jgi:hypothetical protein